MTNPKSEDLRIKKTRRSLREAFIRLIMRMGYDAISIQDIATEAETARITFYRHYRDKEALLTDCLNVLYEELVERTRREIAGGAAASSLPVRVFYEHLQEQEQLYKVLFSSLGTQAVVDRMQDFMVSTLIENLPLVAGSQRPPVPDEIIAVHAVSAQIGLGIWWLKNNKPYSIDDLTQMALWLSLAGLHQTLGMDAADIPIPEQLQKR